MSNLYYLWRYIDIFSVIHVHVPLILTGVGWSLYFICVQRAKKVVSDSPGLADFAIGLVNSVLHLPDGQVQCSLRNSPYRRTVKSKILWVVEMTFGLVNVSFSLPEWQAVKMTFFAPCTLLSFFSVLFCHVFIYKVVLFIIVYNDTAVHVSLVKRSKMLKCATCVCCS